MEPEINVDASTVHIICFKLDLLLEKNPESLPWKSIIFNTNKELMKWSITDQAAIGIQTVQNVF